MPRTHVLLLLLLICQFDCCSCSEPCHDGKSKLNLREEEGIIAPPTKLELAQNKWKQPPCFLLMHIYQKPKQTTGGGKKVGKEAKATKVYTHLAQDNYRTNTSFQISRIQKEGQGKARGAPRQLARNSQAPWLRCGRPQDKVCFDGPPQDPSVVYAY